MNANTRLVVAVILLIVVELLAFYFWSFVFMLEGDPKNHGRLELQLAAWACVGVAVVAPAIFLAWWVRDLTRNK